MLARSLARFLAARGVHYGWVMVVLTFLFTVCAASVMSIPGVLLVPIAREFGWSIGELSGPLGLRMALFGMVAPFAGALMLRYGPRAVLCTSAALMIAGVLAAITMATKVQLWLSFGVVLGIAPGMTALVLGATIATRWFTAQRGLVLGILSAGSATGTLIFLTPAAWLAEHYGWRTAMLPSCAVMAVLAVAFFLLSIDRPADIGLPPFGEKEVATTPVLSGNAFVLSINALRAASGSKVFWVLAFTFGVCGLSTFGLMPHFVTFCADYGISPVTSTGFLTLIGVCDLVGTIGSGWLSDRYDNRWLLGFYYGFRGLALIWLPYSGFTIVGLSAFAVFFGLDYIATIPPTVRLTTRAFGREQAPLVFGWVYASHQLMAGVMALIAGESRDLLASYLPAFVAGGLMCLLATASLTLLRKPGAGVALPQPA